MMIKTENAPKSGKTYRGARIKIHNNNNTKCETYQGENMDTTQNVRKQFAIHEGVMYVFDGKCIYESLSKKVIIADAKNGWQDLLDHLAEVERCSSKQE